jgi:hypothetical protein
MDVWQDRLSEYLDGDLAADERRACLAHLATCDSCAAMLDELRRVVESARHLRDHMPERDLWPAIEHAMLTGEAAAESLAATARGSAPGARPRRERDPWWSWTRWATPQLAAAGIGVALLAGALLWGGRERLPFRTPQVPGVTRNAGSPDDGLGRELQEAEESLAELRAALDRGGAGLDTSTVRVLEQNLALIEVSVAESRRALAADPRNPYLREHLEENIQGKLRMLRRATLIASVR